MDSDYSSRDNDVVDFLSMLTLANIKQRKAILHTLTWKQCTILRQLAYNVMFNSSITLSDKDRQYLQRHSKVVKVLASKKACTVEKAQFFTTHQSVIYKLAKIGLQYLK